MNGLEFGYLRAMVGGILGRAEAFDWTFHGFGFLRCNFGPYRVHVWDTSRAVPGASTIHDHLQWDFRSLVIAGRIRNFRFDEAPDQDPAPGDVYQTATIQTGQGAYIKRQDPPVRLVRRPEEIYLPGMSYSQRAAEIHETVPDAGTVTIIKRDRTDQDLARIFWAVGDWVDAKPRPANLLETLELCAASVLLMEKEDAEAPL